MRCGKIVLGLLLLPACVSPLSSRTLDGPLSYSDVMSNRARYDRSTIVVRLYVTDHFIIGDRRYLLVVGEPAKGDAGRVCEMRANANLVVVASDSSTNAVPRPVVNSNEVELPSIGTEVTLTGTFNNEADGRYVGAGVGGMSEWVASIDHVRRLKATGSTCVLRWSE